MAEILGAVASGISVVQLAGQVAQTIIKLKGLWDEVQEAPTEIKHLLRELESFGLILSHIQDSDAQQPLTGPGDNRISATVLHCSTLCQDAANELEKLVQELELKVRGKAGWKKKLGSARVVLQKDEIKKLKSRMKNARSLLNLAISLRTSSLIQAQPSLIITQLTDHIRTLNPTNSTSLSSPERCEDISAVSSIVSTPNVRDDWNLCISLLESLGKLRFQRKDQQGSRSVHKSFFLTYKPPAWLSNQVWNLMARQMMCGWQVNLKTYRVVSENAPFLKCAQNGDVVGIRRLLATGEALVTDRDEFGWTALHFAVVRRKPEVCKLLISEGADVLAAASRSRRTPLHMIDMTPETKSQTWDICRLLLNSGAGETLIESLSVLHYIDEHDEDMFKFLLTQIFPPFYDFPILQRLEVIRMLLSNCFGTISGSVRLAMSPDSSIDVRLLNCIDPMGQNIAHYLGQCLAWEAAQDRIWCVDIVGNNGVRTVPQLDPEDWDFGARALMRDLAACGMPLNILDTNSMTALGVLFQAASDASCLFHYGTSVQTFQNKTIDLVRMWVLDLSLSGIDIQQYGIQEKAIGLKYEVKFWSSPRRVGIWKIYFTYGASPEEWNLWFWEPFEDFVGEFWAMSEVPQMYPLLMRALICQSQDHGWKATENSPSLLVMV